MAQLVGRWWNGVFGRLARLDLWLYADGDTWRVEARRGGEDGKIWRRDHGTEAAARELVEAMIARNNPGRWLDITNAVLHQRDPRP